MGTIAVTGANGFIGKNLVVRLGELGLEARAIAHELSAAEMATQLGDVDLVVHLAGVNRPQTEDEFTSGNQGMTERLVAALTAVGGRIPLVYASSIQAERDNAYGRSKKAAEDAVAGYGAATGAPVKVFRLPNVFGKWCRPNYNSVVATFCHNISRGLPITVSDANAMLRLVYVDDVVQRFVELAQNPSGTASAQPVAPEYEISLGELAQRLEGFRDSRGSLVTGAVGTGLMRALHATYVSYLAPENFDYPLVSHEDPRGRFVEMLRTPDSGQFSYFTAHPGITRGGHYHHSKTEKFLVVQGTARFGFRHVLTNETFEIVTSGAEPRVVETVPGWAHDVTNIGEDTMVVMLWANELFDREKPDTIAAKVLTP
jgi:UDP-2-acetamido-2,6-beta-L-arabino-hexul-4-ose reductase